MRISYNAIYKVRGLLMVPPCLLELLIVYRESEWDSVIWPAGLGLFFAGVALRTWAQTHLHYRLRMRKTLTSTGPYALVRNPIYIANTLILLSLTVMSELLWFLPIKLAWCAAVYALVVRREESHLLEKYGQPYQAYLDQVPRWIPRLSPRSPAAGGFHHFLLPSIVAELHCLLLLVPAVAKELFTHAPF